MELIKLLDVANPKVIKDTLNKVSQDYETFRTEIEEIANAALNTADTANDTANTALTTVTDYEAVVMESAQDSSSARLVAEEALAMITQADERSQEAALLAEQSFTEASEAVHTSELAMNVANEAKSTVDQALDIGSLGSFVHNVNGIALAHAHMTDDPNQADDEDLSYLATPTLVREAIKNKADLTNDTQEIRAGTLIAKKLQIKTGAIEFDDSANTFWTGSNLNIGGNLEFVGLTTIAKLTLLNVIYPIGSIYMSVNNVSPESFLGGKWDPWGEGRVIVGVGNNGETNYTVSEQRGGSENSVAVHSHSTQNASTYWDLQIRDFWGDQNRLIPYTGANISYGQYSGGNNRYAIEDSSTQKNASTLSYYQEHGHGINATGTQGGNMQPYITCYMWKRTA